MSKTKQKIDPTEIKMDIPLFIRMLEYAREDAKDDMDLHKVTERINSMGDKKLTMDDYNTIIGKDMKKNVNESITLTKGLAKQMGTLLGVNFNKSSLDDFFKIMKHEESEFKYVNSDKGELNTDDYLQIAKVAKAHLTEQKLKLAISQIIVENLNNSDFYNKLKFEINKGDAEYEAQYNKTLGEYSVDSPDQLSEEDKEKFYDSLDKKLKGNVKPVNERFNASIFAKLLKEGKIQKGKIFKEHGVFLTFQELALMEVAPPGREEQVKELKKKFPKDVAYKIAWSQASEHGKPEKKNENTVKLPDGSGATTMTIGDKKNEGEDLTPTKVASDKMPTIPDSPINKNESEEIIEPDTKGKKIIKEKDKEKKDEVAFSTGLNSDRYDKFPNQDRTTNAIPGQQGYSETVPNKNLKKSK